VLFRSRPAKTKKASTFPNLALSPIKAAKLENVKRFIRHTSAIFLMMLSSSQILYSYICEPDSLASSYLGFLITHGGIGDKHGRKSKKLLSLMGNVVKATGKSSKFIAPPLDLHVPLPFNESIPSGMPVAQMQDFKELMVSQPHEFIMCALQHSTDKSCIAGSVKAFKAEFSRAFFMYLPLNVVMTFLFGSNRVLAHPVESAVHVLKSVLRSSVFLTSYCTIAWAAPCFFRNMFKRDERWMYFVNGLMSGFCVVIEAPSRRLELALYVLPRAVESLWNVCSKYGLVRSVPNGEAIVFMIGTSIITTLYQQDPESIDDHYRKVITRFLGVN